jgi:hypothetical protein
MGFSMTRLLSAFVFLASAAVGGWLLIATPSANPIDVKTASAGECRTIEVALDEGYSVSRVETRTICGSPDR